MAYDVYYCLLYVYVHVYVKYQTKYRLVQTSVTERVAPRETRARFCNAQTTTQRLRCGEESLCQMYYKQTTCQIKCISVWLIMNEQVIGGYIYYIYNITYQIPELQIRGT